jgi:hypothetical protein
MSFPYNALVGARPLVTIIIVIHPFSIISHLSPMNVGDHRLNSFLFDGDEENSLASHVEEIKGLRFCKKNVVGKEKHVGRSWTNASFLCLLDLMENKY